MQYAYGTLYTQSGASINMVVNVNPIVTWYRRLAMGPALSGECILVDTPAATRHIGLHSYLWWLLGQRWKWYVRFQTWCWDYAICRFIEERCRMWISLSLYNDDMGCLYVAPIGEVRKFRRAMQISDITIRWHCYKKAICNLAGAVQFTQMLQ